MFAISRVFILAVIFAALAVLAVSCDGDDDDLNPLPYSATDDDDDDNDDSLGSVYGDEHVAPCFVQTAVELLRVGQTNAAKREFECLIENEIDVSRGNLGFAACEFLLLIDEIYTKLIEYTHRPEPNIQDLVDELADRYLSEQKGESRIDRVIEAFKTSASDTKVVLNLRGFVFDVNDLQTYVLPMELDASDASAGVAIFEAIKAALIYFQAYSLDGDLNHLFTWTGTEDYPILDMPLDIGGLLRDPEHPGFLTPAPGAKERTEQARLLLIDAVWRLDQAITRIDAETDNQAAEYLNDLPDLFQQCLVRMEGTFYFPGQAGPILMRSPMALILATDKDGLRASIGDLWHDAHAAFPAFFHFYLNMTAASLDGKWRPLVPGIPIDAKIIFDHPGLLRPILFLLFPEAKGSSENEKAAGGGLPPGFDPAGIAETGNGNLLASFTREGRLKGLYYPGSMAYNHIPYMATVGPPDFAWTPVPFMGAQKEHGSFFGVRTDDGIVWPMDWYDFENTDARDTDRPVKVEYRDPDTPVLYFSYEDPLGIFLIDESIFTPDYDGAPYSTVVRKITVKNDSTATQNASLVYYSAFGINNHYQWLMNIGFFNWIFESNTLFYDGAGISWTGPGWNSPIVERHANDVAIRVDSDKAHPLVRAGIADMYNTSDAAFVMAENGATHTGPLSTPFGGGYLEWDLGALQPGQSATVNVIISIGEGDTPPQARRDASRQADAVRNLGIEESYDRTRDRWVNWMGDADVPSEVMTPREEEIYKRSLYVLKIGQSALTGGSPSNHNMQPMYYMIWGRDSAMHSAAMDAAGLHEEAALYLQYMADVQEPDGHWKTYYTTLGHFLGAFENEQDQTPSVLWAYWIHWKTTGDDSWLAENWDTIQRAADFVINARAANGLMWASADIAEAADVVRQSFYANAIAVAGLNSAAEMASAMDDHRRAKKWSKTALEIRDAIEDVLFIEEKGTFWTALGAAGKYIYDSYTTPIYPFNCYELDDEKSISYFDYQFAPWVENVDPQDDNQSGWVPSRLNTALYLINRYNLTGNEADLEDAKRLAEVCMNNLTESGMLAETFIGQGRTILSKPLTWSHALFVLYQLSKRGESPLPLPRWKTY